MKRRTAILLASTLSLLILTITLLFAHSPLAPEGVVTSPIELWIGHELEHIANHFINPTLHYSSLTYHSPKTVIVHNLTLTAPDPLNPSHTIDILSVKSARIVLVQIPHLGQPLKIKEFHLESPTLRLVATQPTTAATQPNASPPNKTRFVGFYSFFKKKHAPDENGTPEYKPSDYFEITQIEIHNGLLQYDARQKDLKPFTLDGLSSTLTINPNPPTTAGTIATQPDQSTNGWYVVVCKACA